MANLEKHKHNLVNQWLDDEEGTAPAQQRRAQLTGSSAKVTKAAPRKFRPPVLNGHTAKPDPALAREPAPPAKPLDKHSQASSPEHLRKLQRLPKLRAPYSPKH
jgi:hypothetical protein